MLGTTGTEERLVILTGFVRFIHKNEENHCKKNCSYLTQLEFISLWPVSKCPMIIVSLDVESWDSLMDGIVIEVVLGKQ